MVETTEINQTQVKINTMRFTADRQRVIATTTNGFMIIDTATGEVLKACTAFEDGGLHICAPYGRTSIFFVVGTGSGASELRTCLIIWDDANSKKVGEVTFGQEIVEVRTEVDEDNHWVLVQLAGQPDLLVFDFKKGFT